MLNGDNGASNTDPWATKPESGNHWIKTASHVMIVGPPAKAMTGYPKTEDADDKALCHVAGNTLRTPHASYVRETGKLNPVPFTFSLGSSV